MDSEYIVSVKPVGLKEWENFYKSILKYFHQNIR